MKILLLSLLSCCSIAMFSQNKVQKFEIDGMTPNGVFGLTISPDGNEAFWVNSNGGRDTLTIMQSKKTKGKWQKATIAKFSENGKGKNIDPVFSPDGKTLFFQSNRAIEGFPNKTGFDIWAVKKEKNDWSSEYHLGNIVNTDASESFASATKDGSLYFMKDVPEGKGKADIWVSRFKKNKYLPPVNVGETINTSERESNPFIAPDESFIIYFSSAPEGNFGDVDLLISFKNKNSTWSTPVNLGREINTAVGEFCPFYHEKEKRLYFSRNEKVDEKKWIENLYYIDLDLNKYKKN